MGRVGEILQAFPPAADLVDGVGGVAYTGRVGYPGAKTSAGVRQRIISEFPPHRVYIEPFVGSGFVLLGKRPAAVSVVLDLDGAVVAGVVTGARGIGFSAVVKTAWQLAAESLTIAGAGRLVCLQRPQSLVGVVGCGVEFLEAFAPVGDELVYCDPPYLVSRRGRRRSRLYQFEMREASEHERLLRRLLDLKCAVAISGYPTPLYRGLLRRWRHVRFTTSTRGGPAVEFLWCNFPRPSVLFDASYFGGDRRRRQDWRRLVRRMEARFRSLGVTRRVALLDFLQRRLGSGAGD